MTQRRYLSHKELFQLRTELFRHVEEVPGYGWCWKEDVDAEGVIAECVVEFSITQRQVAKTLEAAFEPWRGARPASVATEVDVETLHRAILLVSAETGRNIAKLQQQIDTLRKDIDALTG